MDFSPSGEWLLCTTFDSSIYLVPVHSLLFVTPVTELEL